MTSTYKSTNSLADLFGVNQRTVNRLSVPLSLLSHQSGQWLYVERRFCQFLENIRITYSQIEDGNKKETANLR
jgi:hypothetical protein